MKSIHPVFHAIPVEFGLPLVDELILRKKGYMYPTGSFYKNVPSGITEIRQLISVINFLGKFLLTTKVTSRCCPPGTSLPCFHCCQADQAILQNEWSMKWSKWSRRQLNRSFHSYFREQVFQHVLDRNFLKKIIEMKIILLFSIDLQH